MDIAKCSEEAQKMYQTRKGYRDDSLFGEYGNEVGYHDPVEVLLYETLELQNIQAIDFFHKNYMHLLTEEEKEKIELFMYKCSGPWEYEKVFSSENEFKTFLEVIIRKIIDDRNYCIWLCAQPQDVFDSYVWNPEDIEVYDMDQIDEHEIPSDAIILVDNDTEGCLWCWKEKGYVNRKRRNAP